MSIGKEIIKIAIADDHKLFRQGILYMFSHEPGFKIIAEAGSTEELANLFQSALPDVLLLDIEMPGIDGIESCKYLLKKFPELKIIGLSMHDADSYIFHMMKAGARSYLPKDIDKNTLQMAVEEVYSKGFYFTPAITTAMLKGVKENYHQRRPSKSNKFPFTKREKEILSLICKGLTNSVIADMLFISTRTVEGHRKNLIEKTGTSNSVSLAVYAIKHGLTE
jgi:DNA-binding NarL/FixJ family response regulator